MPNLDRTSSLVDVLEQPHSSSVANGDLISVLSDSVFRSRLLRMARGLDNGKLAIDIILFEDIQVCTMAFGGMLQS